MASNWLSPDEDRAWRAFVFAQRQLVARLNRGLQKSGLSGPDYDVLVVLSAQDGDRMRARELCTALDWEKSRLSHQLRRMESDGLIRRELNPDDARSTMVRLLPAGRTAIETAAPGHAADVRRNFVDLFTAAELNTLATFNERILHHLAADKRALAEEEPS
jgi:DNA-binding MarR family transcriptional regulator